MKQVFCFTEFRTGRTGTTGACSNLTHQSSTSYRKHKHNQLGWNERTTSHSSKIYPPGSVITEAWWRLFDDLFERDVKADIFFFPIGKPESWQKRFPLVCVPLDKKSSILPGSIWQSFLVGDSKGSRVDTKPRGLLNYTGKSCVSPNLSVSTQISVVPALAISLMFHLGGFPM